jgi:hypothetical protein
MVVVVLDPAGAPGDGVWAEDSPGVIQVTSHRAAERMALPLRTPLRSRAEERGANPAASKADAAGQSTNGQLLNSEFPILLVVLQFVKPLFRFFAAIEWTLIWKPLS